MGFALVAVVSALSLQAIRIVSPVLFASYERLGFGVPSSLIALVVVLGPMAALALQRSIDPRRAISLIVVGLGVARIAIQGPGDVGPWLAGVTTILALAALTMCVAADVAGGPRRSVQALVLGAAADAALLGAFRTWDPVWQSGPLPWIVAIVSAVAPAALAFAAPRDGHGPGPVLGWIALGPFLFLQAVVAQNPGFVGSRVGIGLAAATAAVLIADLGAAVVVGSFDRRWTLPFRVVTVAAGVGLAFTTGMAALVALVALTIGSAVMLVAAASPKVPAAGARRVLATAAGALIFAVLLVSSHKGRPLPVRATAVPAAASILLVAPTLVPRTGLPRPAARHRSAVLVGLVLLAVPIGLWFDDPRRDGQEAATVGDATLLDYNVHFAVGDDGQVDPEAIAAAIEVHEPTVVVLHEAGRGSPIGGMTDLVAWLSWRLRLEYVSVAQVEDRFRTTVLYRPGIELASTGHGILPSSSGPVRSYVRVTFTDVAGGPLQIVATHLSGTEEDESTRARQVRAIVRAAGDPTNTVIVGDLNAPLRSDQVTVLQGAGYTSVQHLTGEREPTFPEERIIADHILLGAGLSASDMAVPDVTASDHFPVVVTIERS